MSAGTWWSGPSHDGPMNGGPYATREDAIANATDDHDLGPGDAFQTGRAVPVADPLDADLVINALESWSCDNAPEGLGEDYPTVSPAAKAELSALLASWAKKHGVQPTWFDMEDVQDHVVPEEEPQPISHCPKCSAPQFSTEGFCGGCRG